MNIEEKASKIMDMDCNKRDCEKCKRILGGLRWCPKSYIDEFFEAHEKIKESSVLIKEMYKRLEKEIENE